MKTMSQPSDRSTDYVQLMLDLWPLLATAFAVSVLRGWTHVKRSYLQEHFWPTVLNIFLSGIFMAFVSVGIALLLPLAGVELSPEAEIGVVTLVAGCGMKTFDAFVRKKAGYEIKENSNGS